MNGTECPLLDIAPTGARVARAGWLLPGAEIAFQRGGKSACHARVVWRRGDQAGLQLVSKEERTALSAAPATSPRIVEAA